MLQEGAEFRAKNKLAIDLGVKQWLLADAIARDKKFLSALIPNSEGKHAAQMFGTVGAILVVGVNDRFGVAICIEGVAEFLELLAEFAVVVDLAVENDPGSSILIVNRLLPALQVDDRQAAHAQADRAVEVEPVVIRSTMLDGSAHPRDQRLVNV